MGITNKVYSIYDLRNDIILRKQIRHESGVYQWWCDEKILRKILKNLDIKYSECIKDIEKKDFSIINGGRKIKLHCVYVGESSDLRRRIISNHINGDYSKSTFRKTIAAVLIGKVNEKAINKIIDSFYICWEYKKNCHEYQNKLINMKFRPLNNDDIDSDSKKYSEKRHYCINKSGTGKRSYKITCLRNKIK